MRVFAYLCPSTLVTRATSFLSFCRSHRSLNCCSDRAVYLTELFVKPTAASHGMQVLSLLTPYQSWGLWCFQERAWSIRPLHPSRQRSREWKSQGLDLSDFYSTDFLAAAVVQRFHGSCLVLLESWACCLLAA